MMARSGAINTGCPVDLPRKPVFIDLSFPFRPDFILTSAGDIFRCPAENGGAMGSVWRLNDRCARDHPELFNSAAFVLAEVVDFVIKEREPV